MNMNYMHVIKIQMSTLTTEFKLAKGKKNATDIIQNQFLYINSLKTEYVQMHRGISEVLQRPC